MFLRPTSVRRAFSASTGGGQVDAPSHASEKQPMDVAKIVTSSLTTAALAGLVAIVYIVVLRLIWQVPLVEGWRRTGLVPGDVRSWLWALAILPGWLLVGWLAYQWMPVTTENASSPYLPMLGQGLTRDVVVASLAYGLISAGFGEELLFRGLIGGALGRRLSPRKANLIQGMIFLAPHLLILLVMPRAALLLPTTVLGLALITGWLRIRSGSIGPGLLIHGLGNALVGVLAATSGP